MQQTIILVGLIIATQVVAPLSVSRFPASVAQENLELIVPGERVGPVYADSTAESLRGALGDELVADVDIGIGEGEFVPGTIVFPDDPTRALAILWHDAKRREQPRNVIVCYHNDPWSAESEPCRWRVNGIGLGTRLSELEELNGGPFILTGFDWDYSGTVVSWDGGRLEELLEPEGWRVLLRLAPESDEAGNWVPSMSYEEMAPVLGDHDLASTHPTIRKLDPRIYWIDIRISAEPPAVVGSTGSPPPS